MQVGSGLARASSNVDALHIRRREKHIDEYVDLMDNFKVYLRSIGYRKAFLEKKLKGHSGIIMQDERETDVAESYMKQWIDTTFNNLQTLSDYKTSLYNAGFTKQKTLELSFIIEPLLESSYSPLQLLDIAIECALGKYKRLAPEGQRFYVCKDIQDTWTPNELFKQVYNASTITKVHDAVPLMHIVMQHPNKHTLYFHATNWSSALNIVKHGINHYRGRMCLDFGKNSSFYTTPDLPTAIEWCTKNARKWMGETCILMFALKNKLKKQIRQTHKQKHKEFESATQDWAALVADSRECEGGTNSLDYFDSVYGPMAANIAALINKQGSAKPHEIVKFQLASKSSSFDKYLSEQYIGLINL
jgi:hypothetical protein